MASTGGLYEAMTPRNYRNPLLAEIMSNIGFAQRIVRRYVDAVRGCYRDFHGLAERPMLAGWMSRRR